MVLNSQGRNTDTITFRRQVHEAPPIIEGMLEQPDMPTQNTLPIQTHWEFQFTGDEGLVVQKYPLFSGIGSITKNNFTFNIATTWVRTQPEGDPTPDDNFLYAGQVVKYKLWILRLTI